LGIDLSLKPCRAPAQVSDTRLELWLLNQPFGIAVDQATNRAACFGKLASESIKLWLAREYADWWGAEAVGLGCGLTG
jgi:hypothetical protein